MKQSAMSLNSIRLILDKQNPIGPDDLDFVASVFGGLIVTPEMHDPIDFESFSKAQYEFAQVLAAYRNRALDLDWVDVIQRVVKLSELERKCIQDAVVNQLDLIAINQYGKIIQCAWDQNIHDLKGSTWVINIREYINEAVAEYSDWYEGDNLPSKVIH
ncbi:hypothetical protein MMIC_P0004 [Mariprofundus micogutta]|uniref:Uncharacterized protein n=1 Tax=Mariprofundus micogutta TaxID=1921010 RepID=A0A1L8CJK1_9PROT|nr:hypothetical protein [Mariprofundus micogutta]GAV19076.1 hypothetical protein MMIC_P0004 [Mariprofundus micogutta]